MTTQAVARVVTLIDIRSFHLQVDHIAKAVNILTLLQLLLENVEFCGCHCIDRCSVRRTDGLKVSVLCLSEVDSCFHESSGKWRLHGSDAVDDISDESCADINWR